MRQSRKRPPDRRCHHHWWRATDQSHPIQISRVPCHLRLQNPTRRQSLCERSVDEVASGHWSPVRQEDANLPQGESLQVDCAPSGILQVSVLASDHQAWASSSHNGDEDAKVAAGSHTTRPGWQQDTAKAKTALDESKMTWRLQTSHWKMLWKMKWRKDCKTADRASSGTWTTRKETFDETV